MTIQNASSYIYHKYMKQEISTKFDWRGISGTSVIWISLDREPVSVLQIYDDMINMTDTWIFNFKIVHC